MLMLMLMLLMLKRFPDSFIPSIISVQSGLTITCLVTPATTMRVLLATLAILPTVLCIDPTLICFPRQYEFNTYDAKTQGGSHAAIDADKGMLAAGFINAEGKGAKLVRDFKHKMEYVMTETSCEASPMDPLNDYKGCLPANANMTGSGSLGYGINSLTFQIWDVPVQGKGVDRVAIPVFYVDARMPDDMIVYTNISIGAVQDPN